MGNKKGKVNIPITVKHNTIPTEKYQATLLFGKRKPFKSKRLAIQRKKPLTHIKFTDLGTSCPGNIVKKIIKKGENNKLKMPNIGIKIAAIFVFIGKDGF